MLIARKANRGATLVELLVGLAVAAILVATGVPSFTQWIQSTHIRTAAESIQNGLHLARVEAVRRNAGVRFDLTDATGLVAWTVGCVTVTDDCPATIQSRVATEGSVNARVGISLVEPGDPIPTGYYGAAIAAGTGLVAGATFDGIGRILPADVAAKTYITRVDVTNSAASAARRLVVTVSKGGQIRMCDPALSLATNPQGCS